MATTQLQDIFSRKLYTTMKPENSPEKTNFFESGIVVHKANLDHVANQAQGTATVHYWNDLDADEAPNISTDNPDQKGSVGKATEGDLNTRILYLNKGYGVMDLTSEMATSAPMQQIRNRFGTYWVRQWQRYLIGGSKGIIQSNVANDNSDMVIDLGEFQISANAFQDSAYTAGDSADMFTGIAVHSQVMKQMVQNDLIDFLKDSNGQLTIPTYLGKHVFMDDSLVMDDGRYMSVMYANGAFGYGKGTPHMPVELERDASGGNGGGSEVLWERETFILAPGGFSWVGEASVNKTPTPKEFATASNWKREFKRKNVPFAAVISGQKPNVKPPATGDNDTGTGLGD